jgi:hypothetical protein
MPMRLYAGRMNERDQLILELRGRDYSQREIARQVGLTQPAVKYILDKLDGKPRDRSNRTRSENERNNGNASRKNTRCIRCSRLCWGRSRTAPIPDYVCLACR